LDKDISNNLPGNDYYDYFAPYYQLHPIVTDAIPNMNTRGYLEVVQERAMEALRSLEGAPSVEMFEIPPDVYITDFNTDWDELVSIYFFGRV
jgi:hypothetical protein